MNLVDSYCVEQFPEIFDIYSKRDLEEASAIGSYIFHENYFVPFIVGSSCKYKLLKRVANYIEYLASDANPNLNHLAEIGVLGGLIDKHYYKIGPYLGKASKQAVLKLHKRMNVDLNKWKI